MRGHLATGLAVLVASAVEVAVGVAAHADPAAPQLSPLPARREDAQRLREQLRALDREAAPTTGGEAAALPPPPPPAPSAESARASYAGGALLIVAALSAATTLGLYAATPSEGDTTGYDRAKVLFGFTTAVTGITGLVLWSKGRSVQVAPAVTARAIGVHLVGHL